MTYSINKEIERFSNFPKWASKRLVVEPLCEYGFLVRPRQGEIYTAPGKQTALTLMGMTHGNEWAGVGVLNSLLAMLDAGLVELKIPVAFLLGNPWAAKENKRFLERDLNRCFARQSPEALEEKRAAVLQTPLQNTAYFLDFHQVSQPSDRAFFIFPYTASGFRFARHIAPRATVITHWGDPFSAEGMCSDEFVNSTGGIGVTIELGQNGFDLYQIAVGLQAALGAVQAVTTYLAPATAGLRFPALDADEMGELYTWAEIIPWPERGVVDLQPGWRNFAPLTKGQLVGSVDGTPIKASCGGRLLFPKYLTAEQQKSLTSRPTELYRIMRPISESDLPR